ncbi:hypothetical protein ACLKA7_003272 [Drosophila subpalustris]
MPATGGNTTTAAAGTGNNGVGESMALRACSTSGCRVSKYVEVTKRKCSQFVSEPYIMPKPLVVHGKTSIFQVGGELAKLGDIPSLASKTGSVSGAGQPIYRIKPGTHAHVINYVFIDEGSDSMEKAKSEDQEAMRMLLDSQRESATAKLQKLISTHRGSGQTNANATTAPTTATAATVTAPTAATVAAAVASTNSNLTSVATNNVNVTTPQIHPDLSIASVAGALPLTASLSPAPSKTTTTTAVQAKRSTTATTTAKADNSVHQLQAEILKLRRTVARLNGNAPR